MAEETDSDRIARLEAALEEAEGKIADIADKTEEIAAAPSPRLQRGVKSGWDVFASIYIDKLSFNRQLGVIFAITCTVVVIQWFIAGEGGRANFLWELGLAEPLGLGADGTEYFLFPILAVALPVVFIGGCFARISIERQVLEELNWAGEAQSPEEGSWITYAPVLIVIAALAQIVFMMPLVGAYSGTVNWVLEDDCTHCRLDNLGLVFLFIFGSLSLGSIVTAMVSLPFILRQTGAEHYALVEMTAIATGFAAVLTCLGNLFYQITNDGSGAGPGSWFLMVFTFALSIAAAAFSIGLLTFTKKEKEKAIERIKVEGGTEIDPSLADKEVKENVFSNISFDSDEVGLILAILLPSLLITALTFMFIGMKEAVIMGPLLVIILMVTAQLVKRKANAPPKVRGIGKQIIRRDSPPKKTKRDSSIPAGWTKEQYEQYGHISAEGMDEDL